jgi:hypothetical protein
MAASIAAPLMGAALRHCSPFDAKLVRQTDAQELGMAVVFLEGGPSPMPIPMASTNSIIDSIAGYVNSSIVERKDLQSIKVISLLNLGFFASQRHSPRPAARSSRLVEGDHGGSENVFW